MSSIEAFIAGLFAIGAIVLSLELISAGQGDDWLVSGHGATVDHYTVPGPPYPGGWAPR